MLQLVVTKPSKSVGIVLKVSNDSPGQREAKVVLAKLALMI